MEELQELTGLSYLECERILAETGGDVNKAYETINMFMESLSGMVIAQEGIEQCIRKAGLYEKLAKNLSSYNTMRGGVKGFKGFVFEELHATDATIKGTLTEVVGNNGIADFNILLDNGEMVSAQCKVGYGTGKVDWAQYKGQKIVVDKGNTKLIEGARNAGLEVVECDIPINAAEKEIGEATIDVAKDTAIAAGGAYIIGATATAVAGTTVGGAVVAGAAATTAAVAAVPLIGATVVAAAPFIAVGATIGVAVKIGKKIFRRY